MGIFRRRRNQFSKDVIENELGIENYNLSGTAGKVVYRETFATDEKHPAPNFEAAEDAGFSGETAHANADKHPTPNFEAAEDAGFSGETAHANADKHPTPNFEAADDAGFGDVSTRPKFEQLPSEESSDFRESAHVSSEAEAGEDMPAGVTENAPYHNLAKYKMVGATGDSTVDTHSS